MIDKWELYTADENGQIGVVACQVELPTSLPADLPMLLQWGDRFFVYGENQRTYIEATPVTVEALK